ncbi:MAG: hypothetical protein ACP5PK_06480 [candidate division WOR-3 bacterium]
MLQPVVQLSPPPIVDGETSVYQWIQDSLLLGYRQLTINRIQLDVPVFRIVTVDRFFPLENPSPNRPFRTPPANHQTESTVVTVTRADLTPQTVLFVPAPNDTLYWVAVDYRHRIAEILTRTPNGTIENRLPIGALTFDINQLPLLCRSLKILPGPPLHTLIVLPLTAPPGGMSVLAEITISGIDTVVVPAGTFECQKVIVKLPEFEEEYWVEKVGARRLIKYFNRHTGRGLKLMLSTIGVNPTEKLSH